MNRTTVCRRAVASVVLVAAGLGMTAVPAAARQDTSGSITGAVWFDRDSDGTRDAGEPGRPYASVAVHRDGVLVETVVGDKEGRYSITGLAPGDYSVVKATGGYRATTPNEVSVTVDGAEEVNFGMKGARLRVGAWFDKNGNGSVQSDDYHIVLGEPMLLQMVDGPSYTRWADDVGVYWFDDLPAASYRLHAVTEEGKNDVFTRMGPDSVIDPATGRSAPIALAVAQERSVGVGHMIQRADIELTGITTPAEAVVGRAFDVDADLVNRGPGTDDFCVRITVPKGVRFTGMTGMTQVASPPGTVAGQVKLAPGKRARVGFTLVADKAAATKVTVTVGPSALVDPNSANNTFSSSFPVVAAGGGAVTQPGAQPVVGEKTPAAKAPAKHSAPEVKDLASTGASPVLPLILGSVLLAAGGSLLFFLRRRAARA